MDSRIYFCLSTLISVLVLMLSEATFACPLCVDPKTGVAENKLFSIIGIFSLITIFGIFLIFRMSYRYNKNFSKDLKQEE